MVQVREDMTGWNMWEHGVVNSRLTVIKQVEDFIEPNGSHSAQWLCKCNCEEHTILKVKGSSLKRKDRPTLSCGCIGKEKTIERNISSHKVNKYNLNGEYGIGITFNTNKEFYFDLEDYDKIKNYCWYECRYNNRTCSLRAYNKEHGKYITMHDLLGCKNYDHKDRNPLNNRRNNLRPCSRSENARNGVLQKNNTSGFTGVGWNKANNKWTVYIGCDGKQDFLGYFNDKDDAIKARLCAELEYFGPKFAPQRHLFKQYGITPQNDYEVAI